MHGSGAKMLNLATFWNFNPLPIGLFFELKKHNISQKNTFLCGFEILKTEILFKVKNSKKSEIYRFYLAHIGAVCIKTLTLNRTP